jgi:hypothetical protein
MRRICEKYDFDSRSDRLEVNLNFQMGMWGGKRIWN